jgi:hypothetical protein
MRTGVLVCTLITGLVAGGCQQTPPADTSVCDYQPGKPTTQVDIDDQGVFALLRRDRLTSEGLETVVEQVPVDGGSKLGFKLDHQQLIAVAGPTTLPLDAGSYSWQALTETPGVKKLREQREKLDQGREVAFWVFIGAPVVLAAAWGAAAIFGFFAGHWSGPPLPPP